MDNIQQRKMMADMKQAKIDSAQSVTVIGFDMPFMDMVTFMVKWAIAAIPAAIILFIVGAFAMAIFAGFSGR
jgi:hypothetical protein